MLAIGQQKIIKRGLTDKITLVEAACESLPFEEASFDAVMVAFGVRNFKDPQLGLTEIFRVLSPGGKLAILEFSLPKQKWLRAGYRFYFHRMVPAIGKWFSRDLSAYRYLPDSVEAFPKGEAFVAMLNKAGFTESAYKPLSFGICGLYTGIKRTR
jgi:demethylmenaquinone methyltransferase/2-methoxy-6-polyprenyl-1,4-benzoquinol methylase